MKPSSSINISTQNLPLEQRSQHWLTNINHHIIELDGQDEPVLGIDASLKQYDLGDIKLNHIHSTGHGVQRSSTNISHDGREKIMLSLMLSGEGFACQGLDGGQQAAGDLVIYTSAYPYALAFPDRVEMLVIAIPRQFLVDQLGGWEQKNLIKIGRNFNLGNYSAASFYKYIENYYSGLASSDATVDLLKENLDGLLNQKNISSANLNLQNLLIKSKKWIDQHLHEEDINVDILSHYMHTSSRQVARAFALEGGTVSRYIWNKRLDKCRKDILNIKNKCNLSEIAFRWGFNHPAHFSRSYKKYFGESPTETRKSMGG